VVRHEEISRRSCGASIIGDIQNLTADGPSQPAELAWSRDLLRSLLPSTIPQLSSLKARRRSEDNTGVHYAAEPDTLATVMTPSQCYTMIQMGSEEVLYHFLKY